MISASYIVYMCRKNWASNFCFSLSICSIQVKDLPTLKSLDKNAYNYFYHQVKLDLINGKIPDLVYPNHKGKVLGLIVTSMYIEMREYNTSVDELKKNYKKYVPEKYVKKDTFNIMKQKITEQVEQIKKEHDA